MLRPHLLMMGGKGVGGVFHWEREFLLESRPFKNREGERRSFSFFGDNLSQISLPVTSIGVVYFCPRKLHFGDKQRNTKDRKFPSFLIRCIQIPRSSEA